MNCLSRGLLAAAALSALQGPVLAQSNAQLNGVVDMFIGQRQLAGRTKANLLDSGGMTTSRIAFDGAEDLGGGLKATFGISGFLRADTGAQGRFPGDEGWRRYSFVGLQGGFGALRMGRVTTASFVNALRFNAFADSTTFAPFMLHLYTGGQPLAAPLNVPDSAADNSFAYNSPTVGGFNVSAQYSLGEIAGKSGRNRWVLGAGWSSGPMAVGVTAEQSRVTTVLPAGVDRLSNLQIGASYDLGVAKLFGQYADSELTLAAGSRDYGTWQFGASIPAAGGALLLSYAHTSKSETALADVSRGTLGLGYDYPLSRRTDAYVVWVRDKATGLAVGNTAAVGVRHRF